MSRIQTLPLALALMALVLGFGLDTKADDAPKALTLKDAVTELKAEAKQSLKDGTWLRTKSDYGTKNKISSLKPDQVINELGKRQDRNPSIDAYVKWQLMSYLRFGTLKKASSSKMKNIVSRAPVYIPYPKVPTQLSHHWDKIDGKTNPNKAHIKAAHQAWDVYKMKIKNPLHTKNMPIIEYRKKLRSAIPMSTFWRPYFRLLDLEAMLAAGMDPNEHLATGKKKKLNFGTFYTGVAKAKDFNPKTRAAILSKIRDIKSMSSKAYRAPYGKGKDGNIKYTAGLQVIGKDLKLSELENEFLYAIKEKERPVKKK